MNHTHVTTMLSNLFYRCAEEIPWGKSGADYVCESTGMPLSRTGHSKAATADHASVAIVL